MEDIERLYREYHTPIVRYLTRQLHDADLAEELAQETFVRAFRHGPVHKERAWLFAVATNLIRDTVRRDMRHRKHLEALRAQAAAAESEPATDDIELSPEELRHTATAQQALRTLSDRDRSALYMSQEGLNYQEIAAALGLSVQSVGTTLTRARKRVVQNYESLSRDAATGDAHVAS
ncbi:MAG: sigma-70 family RNA polymerase sigma factor [Gemmatimonas sp.]